VGIEHTVGHIEDCDLTIASTLFHEKTRPCARGELVPRGAAFATVLRLTVVIKFQRLLKSSG